MKKKYILFLFIILSSCYNLGNLSVVSTREIDMEAYYTRVGNGVEGKDVVHIIVFFPTKMNYSLESAINDALEQYNGDLMTRCEITVYGWYIPYLYGQNVIKIKGDVWKKSDYSDHEIQQLNNKESHLLFAFDGEKLKPVEKIEIE